MDVREGREGGARSGRSGVQAGHFRSVLGREGGVGVGGLSKLLSFVNSDVCRGLVHRIPWSVEGAMTD